MIRDLVQQAAQPTMVELAENNSVSQCSDGDGDGDGG